MVETITMESQESSTELGVEQAPPSPASAAQSPELRRDVERLGETLLARVSDVLELTMTRTEGLHLDADLRSSAERISKTSTLALGRWLAGEESRVAREASAETWLFYGELAASRTATLSDVITHCMCWRDAVSEVLEQSAAQLQLNPEALSQARHMLRLGLELGFIQMSQAFDSAQKHSLARP